MAVIIAHQIKKKEFKGGKISPLDLEKILQGYRKGIFSAIKGENLPENARLVKVYATTSSGAKRMVYLVETIKKDAFFLFYRSKNDKIGENISINNPDFKKTLDKYLTMLEEDIQNGNFDVYDI